MIQIKKSCYRFGNTSVTGTTTPEACKRVKKYDEKFIHTWLA